MNIESISLVGLCVFSVIFLILLSHLFFILHNNDEEFTKIFVVVLLFVTMFMWFGFTYHIWKSTNFGAGYLPDTIIVTSTLEEEFITNDKKRQELTNQALREWVDKYGKGVLETAIKPYLKSSPLS